MVSNFEKYRLIEVWITPGSKNKPETRSSRTSYFDNHDEAFAALAAAKGDMNRLLENVDEHRQVWHQ